MKLSKWNYDTKEYDDYEVPDDWKCKTYSNDMDEIVNCPHCGQEVAYGDCYTSLEIHTESGLGFTVCDKCHEEEIKRRKKKYNF